MISNVNETVLAKQIIPGKIMRNNTNASSEIKKEQSKNIDEYVPAEEKESIGIYKVTSDEIGNKTVEFDSLKRESDDSELKSSDDNDIPESCTGNTDAVDREIKLLKEKQQILASKLRNADESETAHIQKQLDSIAHELSLKDNDSYRKEHTVFS